MKEDSLDDKTPPAPASLTPVEADSPPSQPPGRQVVSFAKQIQEVWSRLSDLLFGYDYFLAHRRVDGQKYAESLYRELTAKGNELDCFLDVKHYGAGGLLQMMQTQALKNTSRLIVVVTPEAHDPGSYVLREVQEFKRLQPKGQIVPVATRAVCGKTKWLGPESQLIQELPRYPEAIWVVEDDTEALKEGKPSEAAITKLLNDFTETRRATRRQRWMKGTAMVLAALFAAALIFAILFAVENNRRAALLVEAAEGAYANGANMMRLGQIQQSMHYLAESLRYDSGYRPASHLLRSVMLGVGRQAQLCSIKPTVDGLKIWTLTPDGSMAVASWRDGSVAGFAVTERGFEEKYRFKLTYPPFSIVSSPDGSLVIILSVNGARIHRCDTGKLLADLEVKGKTGRRSPSAVAWAADGKTLFMVQQNNELQGAGELVIWDLEDPAMPKPSFQRMPGPPAVVAVDPDGSKWWAGGAKPDGTGWIAWSREPGGPPITRDLQESVMGLQPLPGLGRVAVRCGQNSLIFLDLATDSLVPFALGYGTSDGAMSLSPDRKLLSVGDFDRQRVFDATVWPPKIGELASQSLPGPVNLTFDPDGLGFVLHTPQGVAVSKNLDNWERAIIPAPQSPFVHVGFSPKARRMVSASVDGTLALWDLRNVSARRQELPGMITPKVLVGRWISETEAWCLQSDGRMNCIKLDGTPAKASEALPGQIMPPLAGARFLEGQNHLAVCGGDGSVTVFSWPELKPVSKAPAVPAKAVAFDACPKSKTVAILTQDLALNVYDWNGVFKWGQPRAVVSVMAAITIDAPRERVIITAKGLGSQGNEAGVFALHTGERRPTEWALSFTPQTHALHPETGRIAVAGPAAGEKHLIAILGPNGGRPLMQWDVGKGEGPITFLGTGDVLAWMGNGMVEFWDPNLGRALGLTNAGYLQGLALSSKRSLLFGWWRFDTRPPFLEEVCLQHAEAPEWMKDTSLSFGGVASTTLGPTWVSLSERIAARQRLEANLKGVESDDNEFARLGKWKLNANADNTFSPRLPATRRQRYAALRATGKADEVISAIHEDPTLPENYFALAKLTADPALSAFYRRYALLLLPDSVAECVVLAKGLRAEGDMTGAEACARHALQLNPGHSGAKEIMTGGSGAPAAKDVGGRGS